MTTITLARIQELCPCYSPYRYAPAWEGTIAELLSDPRVPITDRFWVALRPEFVPDDVLLKFIDFCGGGPTAFDSAVGQIKRSIENVDEHDKNGVIAKVQSDQLAELLDLLGP